MKNIYKITVIIPVYNSSLFINRCVRALYKQDFKKPFEIIFIDDASTDNTIKIIKEKNLKNISIFSLTSNSGPSTARNIGLKHAKGEYIYFLDSDDEIETNALTKLYKTAKEKNYDIVFADKKRIEKNKDQRNNIFLYNKNKEFLKKDILKELKKRFFEPLYMGGLIGCTGRLIKRSIIIKNKVFFNEKLRISEDETFSWDISSYLKKVKYLREKLYIYYINPDMNSAISKGFTHNLSVSNYKLLNNHVKKTFKKLGLPKKEINKLGDQAFIYSIINSLVSISRSILLGKIDLKKGIIVRKKFINNIINDHKIIKSIKNYSLSPNESQLIPKAISQKNLKILELACDQRAKSILQIRRRTK